MIYLQYARIPGLLLCTYLLSTVKMAPSSGHILIPKVLRVVKYISLHISPHIVVDTNTGRQICCFPGQSAHPWHTPLFTCSHLFLQLSFKSAFSTTPWLAFSATLDLLYLPKELLQAFNLYHTMRCSRFIPSIFQSRPGASSTRRRPIRNYASAELDRRCASSFSWWIWARRRRGGATF